MSLSAFTSRLSIFSNSRRLGKAPMVANVDVQESANHPSTPTVTASASDQSAGPATNANAAMEVAPGPEPPSVWLTDPTNAIITGKELNIVVPTMPYKRPSEESRESGGSNPIGLIVSSLRRRMAKKPSVSSVFPASSQSTTAINPNPNPNDPPAWSPPSTLHIAESAVANSSTSGNAARERRCRTLGKELRSKFVRGASGTSSTTARRAKSFIFGKKVHNSVGGAEGAPELSAAQIRTTDTSVAVSGVELDTAGGLSQGGGRGARAKLESEGEREGDSAFSRTVTDAATTPTTVVQGILKSEGKATPQTENEGRKKPSIRFADPLPGRTDPLSESSRLRILNRRVKGRRSTRGIVSAHKFSGWIAEAVLARAKDLANEQRRAQELHISLQEKQERAEGNEHMHEARDVVSEGSASTRGDISGCGAAVKQVRYLESSTAVSASPASAVTGLPTKEVLETGPHERESSLDCEELPATSMPPLNFTHKAINSSNVSLSPNRGFSSNLKATRPHSLNIESGSPRSRDEIREVPRTPAPSLRSNVARNSVEDDEMGYFSA